MTGWSGWPGEPPDGVNHVQDEHTGYVMDRIGPCEWCSGSTWRWRHNDGTECWMDMDGIGPFREVP
jgi:hypothetical protein